MTTRRPASYRCSRSSPARVSTGGAPQAQCERCAGWPECLSGWLLHAGAAGSGQLSTLTRRECATLDMDPSRARRTIRTDRPVWRPPVLSTYLRVSLRIRFSQKEKRKNVVCTLLYCRAPYSFEIKNGGKKLPWLIVLPSQKVVVRVVVMHHTRATPALLRLRSHRT